MANKVRLHKLNGNQKLSVTALHFIVVIDYTEVQTHLSETQAASAHRFHVLLNVKTLVGVHAEGLFNYKSVAVDPECVIKICT